MNLPFRPVARLLAAISIACIASATALAQTRPLNDLQGAMQLGDQGNNTPEGPVQLRDSANGMQRNMQQQRPSMKYQQRPEYKPGEFEEYVQRLVSQMPTQQNQQAAADA